MSTPDQSFNKWKEEMRQDALEKELKRLKQFSTRQSGIIQRLRRTLWFLSLFMVASLSLLAFKGFISWPGPSRMVTLDQPPVQQVNPITQEEPKNQEANMDSAPIQILKPNQDTLTIEIPRDGILFSVQIGAYNTFDLTQFTRNMISIHQDTYEGINQLSLGVFPHYSEASEFLKIVKEIGFKDAFVMATRFGQRIKIQEALMTRQKGNQPTGVYSNKLSRLKD